MKQSQRWANLSKNQWNGSKVIIIYKSMEEIYFQMAFEANWLIQSLLGTEHQQPEPEQQREFKIMVPV